MKMGLTYGEVARRVYSAVTHLLNEGGSSVDQWKVALHPIDVASVQRDAEYQSALYASKATRNHVLGFEVVPDGHLRQGDVRLRAEVAA